MILWGAICFAACAAPAVGWAASTPPCCIFAGNGGSLAIVRLLAAAFTRDHPEIRIEIPPSLGSAGGIRAMTQGAITVALTARPLRSSEQDPGLTAIPYAQTPVVLAAHAAVSDTGLSGEELVHILRGTKTHWRSGEEIIVLALPPDDILPTEIGRAFPAARDAYAASWASGRWTRVFNETDLSARLVQTRGAFGLSSLGAILAERLPIKSLRINGVPPTLAALRQGQYPMAMTLYFVFGAETVPPAARAFIEYARSPASRRLLQENGYQPPH
jgi:phosphate transport system substrate-binding protein